MLKVSVSHILRMIFWLIFSSSCSMMNISFIFKTRPSETAYLLRSGGGGDSPHIFSFYLVFSVNITEKDSFLGALTGL